MTTNIRQVIRACPNCYYELRYPVTQRPPIACPWCGESWVTVEHPWERAKDLIRGLFRRSA